MTDKDQAQIAGALKTALISPNEPDRAGEPSNIVDGLFAIARAIDGLTSSRAQSRLPRAHPMLHLERIRERSDWSLSFSAYRTAHRH